MTNLVFVLGLGANGLAILRSIKNSNWSIIGVAEDSFQVGLYSKFLDSVKKCRVPFEPTFTFQVDNRVSRTHPYPDSGISSKTRWSCRSHEDSCCGSSRAGVWNSGLVPIKYGCQRGDRHRWSSTLPWTLENSRFDACRQENPIGRWKSVAAMGASWIRDVQH